MNARNFVVATVVSLSLIGLVPTLVSGGSAGTLLRMPAIDVVPIASGDMPVGDTPYKPG